LAANGLAQLPIILVNYKAKLSIYKDKTVFLQMITRNITDQLLKSLTFFPAAGLVGPRQVGKTTLAKQLQQMLQKPSFYLDREFDSDVGPCTRRAPEYQ
jgi:predicted AAA+ superfamily ATPase